MKVFEIIPKFVIINETHFYLFYRQENDDKVFSLKPDKRSILYWPDKFKE